MRWARHVARMGERIDPYKILVESVQRIAMGWTARGSNPDGARFSIPVQTGPVSHPGSCTMGTESLSKGGGDKSARGVAVTTLHIWCAEVK